jgi:hypothetical protein
MPASGSMVGGNAGICCCSQLLTDLGPLQAARDRGGNPFLLAWAGRRLEIVAFTLSCGHRASGDSAVTFNVLYVTVSLF